MALLERGPSWRPRSPASYQIGLSIIASSGLTTSVLLLGMCFISPLVMGCKSKVELASFTCPVPPPNSIGQGQGTAGTSGASAVAGSTAGSDSAGAASSAALRETFELPWTTGFENGTCDYEDGRGGFVVTSGGQAVDIVTEPVHSGNFAADFTVADSTSKINQVRGIRKGVLPSAAYYGAWYYFPTPGVKIGGVWNLFHFQGDGKTDPLGRTWDISVAAKDNGELRLDLYTWLLDNLPDQRNHPAIPIGEWVHIEFYWKRAKDKTGEVAVYQNGIRLIQLTGIASDDSNELTEWYVGNYAENLTPSRSTVYLDDVSVSSERTSGKIDE